VTTADEYRQYAQECYESARIATSQAVRMQFVELAQLWLKAAQMMDDSGALSDYSAPRTDGPTSPKRAVGGSDGQSD